MKYLIISIYDCCYVWSVKTNNEFYTRRDYLKGIDNCVLKDLLERIDGLDVNYDYIKTLDYDFIAVCEDGHIDILKE